MKTLVALFGTGDAYLVCALSRAFADQYGSTQLVVKPEHVAIVDLFGLQSYLVDAERVRRGETDLALQQEYHNDPRHSDLVYAHPCFVRSGQRLDRLLAAPRPSQADMYRVHLGLPLSAALETPQNLPHSQRVPGAVFVIPEARSWPNSVPEFWTRLGEKLAVEGWQVWINDPEWSLSELLERAYSAEWVIGPQTGVMAVITAARFPCRKTFVVPPLGIGSRLGDDLSAVWPFAYARTFTGIDYDVDEYEVTPLTIEAIVEDVLASRNATPRAYDPGPVTTVDAPLAPGDFFDRLAVLSVKYQRFCILAPERAPMVDRELLRYVRLRHANRWPRGTDKLYDDLVRVHGRTFDLLQTCVPGALTSEGLSAAAHVEAIKLNRERVSLRQAIDDLCGSPYSEIKSYYGDNAA